jgi:hypothetical protein
VLFEYMHFMDKHAWRRPPRFHPISTSHVHSLEIWTGVGGLNHYVRRIVKRSGRTFSNNPYKIALLSWNFTTTDIYIYSIVIKFFEIRNNLIWLIKLGLNTCMIHACVSWVFAKILKDGPMKDRLWWAFDEDRTTSNVTIKFLIPRGITPGAESDVHE